jgi:alginate O-acetyltransferase complex protein AlgI
MLFLTEQFFIFFSIVFGLYLFLPHIWQNRMLLVGSYIFYGAWDWRYLSLMLFSTTVDYYCGLSIKGSQNRKQKKVFVGISAFANLSLLGTFKYYDFFAQNFQSLMASMNVSVQPFFLNVVLPVGISFYTFQTMSYTIDVFRGKIEPTKNFLDFALYVAYFPQLVAGPIERGARLLPQILKPRHLSKDGFYKGLYFFYWGIFLKVFIADNLAKIVDPVFNSPGPYDGFVVLIATYAFSFQIYGDFAGYSFMAIGLSHMLGIELMENFRRPYFSKNIAEFWRRWHISLSTWFRDYVYIPLGGNRCSRPRLFMNLVITMLLVGIWHGAGWNFVLFGAYNAFMLVIYNWIKTYWDKINTFVQIFLTFHIACGGWLIFRASSMDQVSEMLQGLLFNFHFTSIINAIDKLYFITSLIVVLLVVQAFQDWKNDTLVVFRLPWFFRHGFFALLGFLILAFGEFGQRPFIYFQF